MKKFLFFAAALLGLVACNNKGNEPINPGRQITLTATVDFGQGSNAPGRTVAPNTIPTAVGDTVNFHWEAGDTVVIMNLSGCFKFAVVENSINGSTANFTGTAEGSLGKYVAFYAGKNVDKFVNSTLSNKPLELTNAANNYNIFAMGSGNNDGFTLSMMYNVFKLSLTGSVTLGSVKYYLGDNDNPCTTLNFDGGLALSNTPKEVWIPYNTHTSSDATILRFYDTNGELIMEKSKVLDYKELSWPNTIITFPELEVKAAEDPYLHMTPAAFRSIFLATDSASMEDSLKSVGFDKREISGSGYVYYVGESGPNDFDDAKIYSEMVLALTGEMVQYTCIVKTGEGKECLKLFADAYGGDTVVFGSDSLPYIKAQYTYPAQKSWEDYKTALETCVLTEENPFKCSWAASQVGIFAVAIDKMGETKERLTISMVRLF